MVTSNKSHPIRVVRTPSATRLFSARGPYEAHAGENELTLTYAKGKTSVAYKVLIDATVKVGWIWAELTLTDGKNPVILAGLPKSDALRFADHICDRLIQINAEPIRLIARNLEDLSDPQRYVTAWRFAKIVADAQALQARLPAGLPSNPSKPITVGYLNLIRRFLAEPEDMRRNVNLRFVEKELEQAANFLDTVEARSLTAS